MPTITACGSTSLVTTAFAPILAYSPITIGPKTCAPEPMTTLFFKVGWRFISLCSLDLILGDIPPSVTAC